MSVYYPSAPLLDRARAGRPWHQPGDCPFCADHRASASCVTNAELAELLEVAPETVIRWKKGRRVDGTHADALANRVGAHPGELWPSWWANTPTREKKRKAAA